MTADQFIDCIWVNGDNSQYSGSQTYVHKPGVYAQLRHPTATKASWFMAIEPMLATFRRKIETSGQRQ
jgi:hypothetical protein